jgi:hypothetical protein
MIVNYAHVCMREPMVRPPAPTRVFERGRQGVEPPVHTIAEQDASRTVVVVVVEKSQCWRCSLPKMPTMR